MLEQNLAFVHGKRNVRVANQRGEVVHNGATAHALEVNEMPAVFVEEQIGGLQVAVDNRLRACEEPRGDARVFVANLWQEAGLAITKEEVFFEEFLLPCVEIGVEEGFEFEGKILRGVVKVLDFVEDLGVRGQARGIGVGVRL